MVDFTKGGLCLNLTVRCLNGFVFDILKKNHAHSTLAFILFRRLASVTATIFYDILPLHTFQTVRIGFSAYIYRDVMHSCIDSKTKMLTPSAKGNENEKDPLNMAKWPTKIVIQEQFSVGKTSTHI